MSSDSPIQYGEVKASYFWDDGSGINGDTGAPASGEPMQKGLAASPSWPLGTKGYVVYDGKKADFFIGDRGPGDPAENCNVLLDLDGKTFAELTGESWNDSSYTVSGGNGHIDVEYVITEWGDGAGNEGAPHPMSKSATCDSAVSPVPDRFKPESEKEKEEKKEQERKEKEKKEQEKKEAAEKKEQEQKAAEKKEDQALAGSGGQGGPSAGTEASTAANSVSGFDLAGADLPMAAGALTLALLPAVLITLFLAARRPVDYAAAAAEGESGPLARLGDRFAEVRDSLVRRGAERGRHRA
ncbi:hypothetical protein [Nocardiopsis potens]|uniref:hypothetical protein n=1 Tax=Nocardiopsis potens TaxID=1246458 RepID=UPI0003466813|nr:hypothetical protein [Nocardiopsis potens]